MTRKADSIVAALMEYNKLASELAEKMERVRETLDDACGTLARIRLSEIEIEKKLKLFEARLDELDRVKHSHFWRRRAR